MRRTVHLVIANSDFGQGELAQIGNAISEGATLALASESGEHHELAGPLRKFLGSVLQVASSGETILMQIQDESLTLRAAANSVGVSSPELIRMLDNGVLPFHWRGGHRRVFVKDIDAFKKAGREVQSRQ